MIVLIGSHGTGKSTLLEALKIARPDIYCSDGVGRPIKDAGKQLGLTQHQEQFIINTLQKHKWRTDVVQSNFACTRSIIDEWVYCTIFGMDDLAADRKDIFRDSDYSKARFFYIPIEFPLEEDGTRYAGDKIQQQCDELMVDWIDEFTLPVTRLTGSVENRLQTLLKHI
tara:strand:+ start:4266 stop:4772 length:507 start_codon:yes stop_codon:yes gene_type:complete